MTKYKFKIDTPWGKKGEFYTVNHIWNASLKKWEKPNIIYDFPELFEEIQEKTNHEKWHDILCEKLKTLNPDVLFAVAVVLNDLGYNADAAYAEMFGGEK